jgi:hypothetical protein
MQRRTLQSIRRGVEAAVIASVPQVLLPKLEAQAFLSDRESADIGPHFIEALAHKARQPLPEDVKWLAASAFHFGYAALWGTLYALAYERRPVKPWVGGLALATLIHGITFPRWGLAVLTGTEDPPRDRTWRMEAVLATAPFVFGLGTALLYGRGPRRTMLHRLRHAWRVRA